MDRRAERERQRQRELQREKLRRRRRKKRNDAKKIGILVGVLAIIAMVVIGGVFWFLKTYVNQYEEDQVVAGIFIENISVGGMTESEIYEVIDGIIEDRSSATITLITTSPVSSETKVTLGELGLDDVNGAEIVDEMVAYGKSGNLWSRYRALRNLEENEVTYDLAYEIDSELISEFVDVTYVDMIESPVDAYLEFVDGVLTVIEGSEGEQINIEDAVTQIESFMSDDWDGESGEIYLVTEIVQPDVTAESLESATDVLGTFSTYCANSGTRWDNVHRGAELVNGTVVMPGEEFAFATTVQPFTEENGYGNAGSYLDGEVVDSMGGGICQVSTTLYNAALYAELEITQRSAHSMLVSYVDPAMDAAIAGDYKDLKFVNNTDSPIYIYGDLSGTTLTFTIYGEETRDEDRTLSFESVVTADNGYGDPIFEENSSLELGTINKISSGYVGKVAELWKKVYENGELVDEVKINTSTYSSSSETYEVGTKSDSKEATELVQVAIEKQDEDKINTAIAKAEALIEEEEAEAKAEEEAKAEAEAQAEAQTDTQAETDADTQVEEVQE